MAVRKSSRQLSTSSSDVIMAYASWRDIPKRSSSWSVLSVLAITMSKASLVAEVKLLTEVLSCFFCALILDFDLLICITF